MMSETGTYFTHPEQRGKRGDPTIRHSGRAHIRGKIRRVWRPRYLELCDFGFVRYYELPPLADITMPQEADWQHINMVIKDTLIIHHARIIDVTTLRDLHVGLPRGSFGFLFRGQRIGGSSSHAMNSDFGFQKSDFEDIQYDSHGQSCSGNPVGSEANPPREYFCAVSTLEEAQSWVVALQWAVHACKKTMLKSCSLGESDNDGDMVSLSSLDGNGELSSDRKNRPPPTDGDQTLQTPKSVSPNHKHRSQSKSTRTLVTRVSGFRLVLGAQLLRWELAYEVALLLVENKQDTVEERRILLTVRELGKMLNDMSFSMQRCEYLRKDLQERIKSLPQIHTYTDKQDSNTRCSIETIDGSLGMMNSILRVLTREPEMVNSQPMRSLFALDISRPIIDDTTCWKLWGMRTASNAPVLYRHTRSMASNANLNDFVRIWLSRPPKRLSSMNRMKRSCLGIEVWILQRPWIILGGFGGFLALIYSASQVYQEVVTSISIRIDVLVLICGLSYILGERRGRVSRQNKTRNQRKLLGSRERSKAALMAGEDVASDSQLYQLRAGRGNTFTSNSNKNVSSSLASGDDDVERSLSDECMYDDGEDIDYEDDGIESEEIVNKGKLSSPIPRYPDNNGLSCWSEPSNPSMFNVRGKTYLQDRIKVPSGAPPFKCRGVDLWLTDNPERHIARHPNVLGGKLNEDDTFLVNFLLPFGNFVAYFSVPPLSEFPNKKVAKVWSGFLAGDQQYRDSRLKLLPIVMDGPWIVKAAVGNGKSPALLGKVIPLQYFFQRPTGTKRGTYEVDVIITASSIAKGILNVVKGHAKALSIAFAMIIEATTEEELPETVLCCFQIHALDLAECPRLPENNADDAGAFH